MKYGLAVFLFVALPCFAQTTTSGTAETSGPCSPAVSGSKNIFTIKCGIDEKQGREMLKILNEILRNQIDPNAVMTKLDEIQKGIRQLTDREWAELSKAQIQSLCTALGAPPAQKVQIIVANEDENRLLLANQLVGGFRCAKWDADVATVMELRSPNSPIPSGILVSVREETPPVDTVANALIAVFGRDAVRGLLNKDVQPGIIEVRIYYKPK